MKNTKLNKDENSISKEDILNISYLKTYCKNCENFVDVYIDTTDNKYVCKICKNKTIVIGTEKAINDYFSNKF